ncbi:MAG: hypothetical protein ACRYFX_10040 [Janthinobacterium lividum]
MPVHFIDPATGPYQLPTAWREVTTKQYLDLSREQLLTVGQAAEYFAGRPVEVTDFVAAALSWLGEPPPTEGGRPYPAVGEGTYQQVESIRKLLAQQPLHQCFCQVYGLLQGRWHNGAREFRQGWASRLAAYCADYPITDTYPAVAACLAQLHDYFKPDGGPFYALTLPDETEAGRKAQQAGSERLNSFGYLNVASEYAQRWGQMPDTVLAMPWLSMMIYLLRDREVAQVQENLTKQTSPKNQHD